MTFVLIPSVEQRETAGRSTGKRSSKHAATDCADTTLLLNEKLQTDVKTVDLAAKQIQTVLYAVITRTAPESEYNTAYLHTKTAEQIMSQAMHLNHLGHNIRMLNMKSGNTYVKRKQDRQ